MKNPRMEKLARLQRQYHRKHPWQLSSAGLWAKTCYAEKKPDDLSWWDDVGFILNRRRVIVWWQHPRCIYHDEISERSFELAKPYETQDVLRSFAKSTPNYQRVGKSRKKIVSYTRSPSIGEDRRYYDELNAIEDRLSEQGIDFEVRPSWTRKRLPWATGVSLIAPLEVRSKADIGIVADLARQLLLGKTSLEQEFPAYQYTQADWLAEAQKRSHTAR